ncbi:MAG: hypothetical protein CVU05_11500 [Bacteroidetes bacterium HGW-Bacteroidetes-21]|nr:MAG: hypothetical protein CVU05_11500 [Bacteroidetes bacterium HGW-Bacteroidetes-21]
MATILNAQEINSKNGFAYLPEGEEFAIGIDATPIFNFFGNMVKINSGAPFADPSAFNFTNGNNAIYGKYFVDANTAYRGSIRIGMTTFKDKNYVMQDGQADPLVTVEDMGKVSDRNIVLSAGMEKRRGKNRLQGFYGAEFGIMLAGGKNSFEYGNGYTTTNTAPTITDFSGSLGVVNDLGGGARVTEEKLGGTFGLGLRAFVGVEYFIMPKISVGGEFGWGLQIASQGEGELSLEYWDIANSTIKTQTTKTAGGGFSGFDTDNVGGNIFMMFHF